MKPIPIRAQRIIAIIPGLNLFCLPIFIYNSFFVKFTLKDYLRSWIFLIFPALFLGILREIVIPLLPTAEVIIGHIFNYFILLSAGYRLIEFQERYF